MFFKQLGICGGDSFIDKDGVHCVAVPAESLGWMAANMEQITLCADNPTEKQKKEAAAAADTAYGILVSIGEEEEYERDGWQSFYRWIQSRYGKADNPFGDLAADLKDDPNRDFDCASCGFMDCFLGVVQISRELKRKGMVDTFREAWLEYVQDQQRKHGPGADDDSQEGPFGDVCAALMWLQLAYEQQIKPCAESGYTYDQHMAYIKTDVESAMEYIRSAINAMEPVSGGNNQASTGAALGERVSGGNDSHDSTGTAPASGGDQASKAGAAAAAPADDPKAEPLPWGEQLTLCPFRGKACTMACALWSREQESCAFSLAAECLADMIVHGVDGKGWAVRLINKGV